MMNAGALGYGSNEDALSKKSKSKKSGTESEIKNYRIGVFANTASLPSYLTEVILSHNAERNEVLESGALLKALGDQNADDAKQTVKDQFKKLRA